MQLKYLALCAPIVLPAVAQAAPELLPQLSSSSRLKPDASPGRQTPFSELSIAGVRLGSRTELAQAGGLKPEPGTLLAIHGAPDAFIQLAISGVVLRPVLRDAKTGSQTPLGTNLNNAKLPEWVRAVAIEPDVGHHTWLYNRGTYSMAFSVSLSGFVDAISVAGSDAKSPTLEAKGIAGSVKMGTDLRLVLYRFGFPETIESYGVDNKDPKMRTFELRYNGADAKVETPGGLVFTIRDNRVVRFYAFMK